MKNHTDLGQSRKLDKILRHDSADMCWCNNSIRGLNYTDEFSANLYTVKEMKDAFDTAFNGWDKYWKLIPCWSLSALLSVLPFHLIVDNQRYCFSMEKGLDKNGETYAIKYAVFNTTFYFHLTDYYNNPVDACVEMILKLYEQKLL